MHQEVQKYLGYSRPFAGLEKGRQAYRLLYMEWGKGGIEESLATVLYFKSRAEWMKYLDFSDIIWGEGGRGCRRISSTLAGQDRWRESVEVVVR